MPKAAHRGLDDRLLSATQLARAAPGAEPPHSPQLAAAFVREVGAGSERNQAA